MNAEDLKKSLLEGLLSDEKQTTLTELPKYIKNPLERITEPHSAINVKQEEGDKPKRYLMAERDKEAAAQARQAYAAYAENTRKSERLRAEINQGIAAGQDVTELLLMALECISLMTNEPFFYRQNKDVLEKHKATGPV